MSLWRKVTRIFRGRSPDPALPEPEAEPEKPGQITPYWFVPVYPRPRKGIAVYKPEEIYASEEDRLIKPIFRMLGLTNKAVGKYLTPVVMNYIRYVHLLPASRSDHHSDLEGLLFHGLDTARFAVKFSEGYMPYQGGNPELKGAYETQWRVAVTLAGMLHDVGKPATDMIVTSLDGTLEWNPNVESLYDWAERNKVSYYVINYRSNRASLHENPAIITQMVSRIVPAETVGFITNNGFREIWEEQFLGSFAAESDSIIRKIVLEADMASVKKDNQNQADESSSAFGISTHIMFARVLRDLLEDHQHGFSWKLNEPGAHAFYSGEKLPDTEAPVLYITWNSKELQDLWKIADMEREQLEGFPRNIGRLGEVLADKHFAVSKKGCPGIPRFRRVIRAKGEGTFLGAEARVENAKNELARLSGEDREDLDKIERVLNSCGLESLPVILFLRKDRVFETEPRPARLHFLEKTSLGFDIAPEPAISEDTEPAPGSQETASENAVPEESVAAGVPENVGPASSPAITAPAPVSIHETDDEMEDIEDMEDTDEPAETGESISGDTAKKEAAELMNFLPGGDKTPAASQEKISCPKEQKPPVSPKKEEMAPSTSPAPVTDPVIAPAAPEKPVPARAIPAGKPAVPMFSFGEPKNKPEKQDSPKNMVGEKIRPGSAAPIPEKKPEKKFFTFSDHGSEPRKQTKKPDPAETGKQAARPDKKPVSAPAPIISQKPQDNAPVPEKVRKEAPAVSPAPVFAPASPVPVPARPAPAPQTPVKKAPPAASAGSLKAFTVTAPKELSHEEPKKEAVPDPMAAGAAELAINPERIREGRRYQPDSAVRKEIAEHMVRNQDGIRMMPKKTKGYDGENKAVKLEQDERIQKWTDEMQKGAKAFAGQVELTREEYMAKNGLMMDPALLKRKANLTDTGKKEARERLRQSYLDVLKKLPSEMREMFAPAIRGETRISSGMLVTNNTLYGLKVDHLWEFGLYMEVSSYDELTGYLLNNNVIRKNPNNPLSLFTQIGKYNCLCLEAKLTEALLFFQLEIAPLSDQEKKKAEEGSRAYLAGTSESTGTGAPEDPAPTESGKPVSLNELISLILNKLADEFQAGGGELSGKVNENPDDWEAEDNFQTIFERVKVRYKNPLLTSTALRAKLQSFKPAGARKFRIRQVKRLLLLKGVRNDE